MPEMRAVVANRIYDLGAVLGGYTYLDGSLGRLVGVVPKAP
jgi:hypothetical protein